MSRPLHRLYCLRPHGAHVLATINATETGEVEVEIITAYATSAGLAKQPRTFTKADLDGATSLGIWALCACGDLYDVNIAALLRGDPDRPRLVPPENQTGVSYHRTRHKGE